MNPNKIDAKRRQEIEAQNDRYEGEKEELLFMLGDLRNFWLATFNMNSS